MGRAVTILPMSGGARLLWASILVAGCSGAAAGGDPAPGGNELEPCGDGWRMAAEECDGFDVAGTNCVEAGFAGGLLTCSSACTFDTSLCTGTGPVCPDGAATGFEQCDGADLRGFDCAGLGYDGGTLACAGDCAFEVSGCTGSGAECNDGVAEGLEECDKYDHRGATCETLGYTGGSLACDTGCNLLTRNCTIPDLLDSATACAGAYNPDQILDYQLTMAAGDWSALKADSTNSVYFAAQLQCEGDAPLSVGIRRKRSGDTGKPGLKVDINWSVPGQTFYDLKKLSFESGISEGSGTASVRDLLAEYLGWRIMVLSGALSGRAVFARVFVNGELLGVYVHVEQVDKRFLRSRLGEDEGWLYKHSGSPDDGYKTNETVLNPYEDYFCFWEKNGCAIPSAEVLAAELPSHLDIFQLLRVGGVNALIGNTDAPLAKQNNYIFYDQAPGYRYYLPWDLDTTMRDELSMFRITSGVGGVTQMYWDVLFPTWEDDYDQLMTELLAAPLALAVIEAEIDRAVNVAAVALDADPFVDGAASDAALDLRTWWQSRHPGAVTELDGH
jgi:hypothetical protein